MLEVKNLTKIYKPKRGVPVKALDDVSLKFEDTGMVFVLGKSGSGKSTLLNMIGGLDNMTKGEIIIKGKSSAAFSQSDFDSYRNTFIGFIFQEYNILNEFTVGKNIALALELQGKKGDKAAVNDILEQVDLKGYRNRKPNELSGGQKQRVAIARALIKDPEIIMADEPTGALDSNTGKQVFETLQKLSKTKLVIIVSHDREYAEYYGDRVIEFADGKVISDIKKYKAQSHVISDGVSIVDNSIIHVKKGHKFSKEEKDAVIKFLEDSPGEMIISKDERSNQEFRKTARIDSDGNKESFADTSEKNQTFKQYDKSDFKLIRSRLPLKHSFKIGASGLKAKPIRLVFTILLSAIAFGMFGLVDTLAAYNKYDATYLSMKESDINYLSLMKQQGNKYGSGKNDISFRSQNMSEADFSGIEEKFSNYSFSKVYSINNAYYDYNIYERHQTNPDIGMYYSRTMYSGSYLFRFEGILESTSAKLTSSGITILGGTYPQNYGEIAISEYVFNGFKDLGYCDGVPDNDGKYKKITINTYNDILGKKITVGETDYTITCVLDTDFPEDRYAEYKSSATEDISGLDMAKYYLMSSELSTMGSSSYHALMFVKEGFYDNLNASEGFLQGYTDVWLTENTSRGYYSDVKNGAYGYDRLNYFATFNNTTKAGAVFADKTKTTLADDEVLLNLPAFLSLFNVSGDPLTRVRAYISKIYESELKADFAAWLETKEDWENYDKTNLSVDYYIEILEFKQPGDFPYPDGVSSYNELFHPQGSLHNKIAESYIFDELFDSGNKTFLNIDYGDRNDYDKSYTLKVVGIYLPDDSENDPTSNSSSVVCAQSRINHLMTGSSENIKFAIANMSGSKAADMAVIKASYNYDDNLVRYSLVNAVSYSIDMVNSTVEQMSQIFLYIGIGFAVFAALMLLNFISVSISYKKKEIGILRAIGARGSDVFGIFFNEALIIAFISFLFASIATGIGATLLNGVIRDQLNVLISLLNFGIRQILLVLGVSVLTAFIACFFPVFNTSRKKPIEAIRQG